MPRAHRASWGLRLVAQNLAIQAPTRDLTFKHLSHKRGDSALWQTTHDSSWLRWLHETLWIIPTRLTKSTGPHWKCTGPWFVEGMSHQFHPPETSALHLPSEHLQPPDFAPAPEPRAIASAGWRPVQKWGLHSCCPGAEWISPNRDFPGWRRLRAQFPQQPLMMLGRVETTPSAQKCLNKGWCHCKKGQRNSSRTVFCPHSHAPPNNGKNQSVYKILQVGPGCGQTMSKSLSQPCRAEIFKII